MVLDSLSLKSNFAEFKRVFNLFDANGVQLICSQGESHLIDDQLVR